MRPACSSSRPAGSGTGHEHGGPWIRIALSVRAKYVHVRQEGARRMIRVGQAQAKRPGPAAAAHSPQTSGVNGTTGAAQSRARDELLARR